MEWVFTQVLEKRPNLENPILIEGLPGIGNVGKIVVDYLVEKLNAKKLYTIYSDHMPHSVFVNENNLVDLPKLEIYYRKARKSRDMLFLVGDSQPVDEASCYSFCRSVLNVIAEYGCKEVITLGGVGLKEIPDNPKIYITGTSEKFVKKFATKETVKDLYGSIGPIVGVSGVLVALSKLKGAHGIALLGETLGNPMYVGIRTAKSLINFLSNQLNFRISLKDLESEIQTMESELKAVDELEHLQQENPELKGVADANYIG